MAIVRWICDPRKHLDMRWKEAFEITIERQREFAIIQSSPIGLPPVGTGKQLKTGRQGFLQISSQEQFNKIFYSIALPPLYPSAMLEQQTQAQYYDKLLHHLNRTFLMNMKAQELFLDMSRHTKTIRFKSIKNIYNTLTEGKADEVIYQKDKQQLISNHVFNQKFTQRTCWRIIQKLITKVSYFLTNEHLLAALAPSVIKAISFLRNANEKVNNRASFVQFFEEVLDSIIAENNILEEKIYDLLIKRGYIYSIDQFYRLNRFEEGPHADYICPEPEADVRDGEEEESLEVAGKSIDTSSIVMSKKSRSRFGVFSSKRSALHNRSRTNMQEEENIPEQEANAQEVVEEDGSDEQVRAEQFNRMSHLIHQQVERTVDDLLNNHNFASYIDTARSEDHVSSLHDSNSKSVKPSLVRQLLKNLKNRNFKANQKILVINGSMDKGKEEERKNSSQTLLKNKKHKDAASLQKNRTSIAMALSKGMKERIFKNEHLADIEDLIINNLDRLEGARGEKGEKGEQEDRKVFQRGPIKKNIFFRSQARQHTQILPIHNEQTTAQSARRASNIQFLNSAFAFQGKQPKNTIGELRRTSNFGPECHMSQISSNRTIETASFQEKLNFIERYINKGSGKSSSKQHRSHKKSHISSGSQAVSRFAAELKDPPAKQNRFFCGHLRGRTEEFNPTLLKITAQKYNKCVTEQPEAIKTLELRELNILSGIDELANIRSDSDLTVKSKAEAGAGGPGRIGEGYRHCRPYEVYDRKLRRIL